ERVENAQYVKINQNVPRGEIYDRNGNVLVQNKSERAIFFTRHRNMSNGEIMEIAEKLSEYLKMDDEKISLRDKQDYALNKYFDDLLKDEDKNIISIYTKMIVASELNPVTIKGSDVTEKEFASINEDLDDLEGITTGMDWKREYPYGSTLRTIFGDISSPEEGLPKELSEYYKSLGYSQNDRVGKSYLEFQYEDILRGEKE